MATNKDTLELLREARKKAIDVARESGAEGTDAEIESMLVQMEKAIQDARSDGLSGDFDSATVYLDDNRNFSPGLHQAAIEGLDAVRTQQIMAMISTMHEHNQEVTFAALQAKEGFADITDKQYEMALEGEFLRSRNEKQADVDAAAPQIFACLDGSSELSLSDVRSRMDDSQYEDALTAVLAEQASELAEIMGANALVPEGVDSSEISSFSDTGSLSWSLSSSVADEVGWLVNEAFSTDDPEKRIAALEKSVQRQHAALTVAQLSEEQITRLQQSINIAITDGNLSFETIQGSHPTLTAELYQSMLMHSLAEIPNKEQIPLIEYYKSSDARLHGELLNETEKLERALTEATQMFDIIEINQAVLRDWYQAYRDAHPTVNMDSIAFKAASNILLLEERTGTEQDLDQELRRMRVEPNSEEYKQAQVQYAQARVDAQEFKDAVDRLIPVEINEEKAQAWFNANKDHSIGSDAFMDSLGEYLAENVPPGITADDILHIAKRVGRRPSLEEVREEDLVKAITKCSYRLDSAGQDLGSLISGEIHSNWHTPTKVGEYADESLILNETKVNTLMLTRSSLLKADKNPINNPESFTVGGMQPIIPESLRQMNIAFVNRASREPFQPNPVDSPSSDYVRMALEGISTPQLKRVKNGEITDEAEIDAIIEPFIAEPLLLAYIAKYHPGAMTERSSIFDTLVEHEAYQNFVATLDRNSPEVQKLIASLKENGNAYNERLMGEIVNPDQDPDLHHLFQEFEFMLPISFQEHVADVELQNLDTLEAFYQSQLGAVALPTAKRAKMFGKMQERYEEIAELKAQFPEAKEKLRTQLNREAVIQEIYDRLLNDQPITKDDLDAFIKATFDLQEGNEEQVTAEYNFAMGHLVIKLDQQFPDLGILNVAANQSLAIEERYEKAARLSYRKQKMNQFVRERYNVGQDTTVEMLMQNFTNVEEEVCIEALYQLIRDIDPDLYQLIRDTDPDLNEPSIQNILGSAITPQAQAEAGVKRLAELQEVRLFRQEMFDLAKERMVEIKLAGHKITKEALFNVTAEEYERREEDYAQVLNSLIVENKLLLGVDKALDPKENRKLSLTDRYINALDIVAKHMVFDEKVEQVINRIQDVEEGVGYISGTELFSIDEAMWESGRRQNAEILTEALNAIDPDRKIPGINEALSRVTNGGKLREERLVDAVNIAYRAPTVRKEIEMQLALGEPLTIPEGVDDFIYNAALIQALEARGYEGFSLFDSGLQSSELEVQLKELEGSNPKAFGFIKEITVNEVLAEFVAEHPNGPTPDEIESFFPAEKIGTKREYHTPSHDQHFVAKYNAKMVPLFDRMQVSQPKQTFEWTQDVLSALPEEGAMKKLHFDAIHNIKRSFLEGREVPHKFSSLQPHNQVMKTVLLSNVYRYRQDETNRQVAEYIQRIPLTARIDESESTLEQINEQIEELKTRHTDLQEINSLLTTSERSVEEEAKVQALITERKNQDATNIKTDAEYISDMLRENIDELAVIQQKLDTLDQKNRAVQETIDQEVLNVVADTMILRHLVKRHNATFSCAGLNGDKLKNDLRQTPEYQEIRSLLGEKELAPFVKGFGQLAVYESSRFKLLVETDLKKFVEDAQSLTTDQSEIIDTLDNRVETILNNQELQKFIYQREIEDLENTKEFLLSPFARESYAGNKSTKNQYSTAVTYVEDQLLQARSGLAYVIENGQGKEDTALRPYLQDIQDKLVATDRREVFAQKHAQYTEMQEALTGELYGIYGNYISNKGTIKRFKSNELKKALLQFAEKNGIYDESLEGIKSLVLLEEVQNRVDNKILATVVEGIGLSPHLYQGMKAHYNLDPRMSKENFMNAIREKGVDVLLVDMERALSALPMLSMSPALQDEALYRHALIEVIFDADPERVPSNASDIEIGELENLALAKKPYKYAYRVDLLTPHESINDVMAVVELSKQDFYTNPEEVKAMLEHFEQQFEVGVTNITAAYQQEDLVAKSEAPGSHPPLSGAIPIIEPETVEVQATREIIEALWRGGIEEKTTASFLIEKAQQIQDNVIDVAQLEIECSEQKKHLSSDLQAIITDFQTHYKDNLIQARASKEQEPPPAQLDMAAIEAGEIRSRRRRVSPDREAIEAARDAARQKVAEDRLTATKETILSNPELEATVRAFVGIDDDLSLADTLDTLDQDEINALINEAVDSEKSMTDSVEQFESIETQSVASNVRAASTTTTTTTTTPPAKPDQRLKPSLKRTGDDISVKSSEETVLEADAGSVNESHTTFTSISGAVAEAARAEGQSLRKQGAKNIAGETTAPPVADAVHTDRVADQSQQAVPRRGGGGRQ